MASTHEHWILESIRLAREARDRGDEPFGALLVADGVSILEARNAVNTGNDITQHAELRLISKAGSALDPDEVASATLYTSTEPCAMCCGAVYWSGIDHIVFGFSASSLEAMTGGSGLRQPSRRVLGSASRKINIEGPVLEAEARAVHEGYW